MWKITKGLALITEGLKEAFYKATAKLTEEVKETPVTKKTPIYKRWEKKAFYLKNKTKDSISERAFYKRLEKGESLEEAIVRKRK